jgi:hypothetical protein
MPASKHNLVGSCHPLTLSSKPIDAPVNTPADMDDSFLWRTYTSDEEAASPLGNDSNSLRSRSSFSSLHSDFSFEDNLTPADHHCRMAQLVTILATGKPTVVTLPSPDPEKKEKSRPKLPALDTSRRTIRRQSPIIDATGHNPTRPRSISKRFSTQQPLLPREEKEVEEEEDNASTVRSSQDSEKSLKRTASFHWSTSPPSPTSTAPSSVEEQPSPPQPKRQGRVSRYVDLLEAARALPPTPTTTTSSPVFPSPHLGHRRNSSIMQRRHKFALNRFGNSFGRKDSVGGSDDGNDGNEPATTQKDPETATAPAPSPVPRARDPSRPRVLQKKMVARAANERAPTIVLPPFPGE